MVLLIDTENTIDESVNRDAFLEKMETKKPLVLSLRRRQGSEGLRNGTIMRHIESNSDSEYLRITRIL